MTSASTLGPLLSAMNRPRRKTVFPAARLNDGRIHIGAVDPRRASLIEDPSGRIWELLGLLDGERNCIEIAAVLRVRWPATTDSEVAQAIDTLVRNGYVEDAAVHINPAVDERYSRNRAFLSFYASHPLSSTALQERLSESRVVILGIGGLGGCLAAAFAGLGVGNLLLVDDDIVEVSNLNRQVLYSSTDLGKPKVLAAKRRLEILNPHVQVDTQRRRISDGASASSLFRGTDLVCCAADRPRATLHKWMNAGSIGSGVPWLFGQSIGLTLQAAAFSPGDSGCYECMTTAYVRGSSNVDAWIGLSDPGSVDNDRSVSPCVAPTASILGGFASLLGLRILLDRGDSDSLNATFLFDIDGFHLTRAPFSRNDACAVCGSAGPPGG